MTLFKRSHLHLSLSLLLFSPFSHWVELGDAVWPKLIATIQPPWSRKSLVAWTLTLATQLLHTDITKPIWHYKPHSAYFTAKKTWPWLPFNHFNWRGAAVCFLFLGKCLCKLDLMDLIENFAQRKLAWSGIAFSYYNNQCWSCICHLLGKGLLLLSNHTLHFLAEMHISI